MKDLPTSAPPGTTKVWVFNIFMHTNVPSIDAYDFVAVTKNGVKVKSRGSTTLIRNSIERRFYFSEADLGQALRRHLENRVKLLKQTMEECQEALDRGSVSVCHHKQLSTPTG